MALFIVDKDTPRLFMIDCLEIGLFWPYLPITKEYKKFLTSPEVSNFQRSYTLISNGEVFAKSNGKFLTTLSRLKR